MRCGRLPLCSTWRVYVPSSARVTVGLRVSTPVVRSQASAQAWTSRSVAEARESMKSARGALENLWRGGGGGGGGGDLVAGEVGVNAGEEVLLAEPGHQLPECGGALGVGDAVEVEEGRGGVVDFLGGDGVGGGALVGVVAPALAHDAEVDPGVGEAGGFGEGLVAHVLGEGLVQPDVVPPAQGDEVAEPHVG